MTSPSKRVLLLCIDGCRSECMALFGQKLCKRFIEQPQSVYSFMCDVAAAKDSRAVSGPSWATILTGLGADEHKVTSNEPKAEVPESAPSIAQTSEASRLELVLSTSWAGFRDILRPPQEAQIHTFPLDGKDVQKWKSSTAQASTALKQAISKKLEDGGAALVVGFYDMIDEIGHTYGFGPHVPEYAAAVEFTAAECGSILDSLQAALLPDEEWLVVVISDHGGSCTDGLRKVCPGPFEEFEKDHLGSQQVKYKGVHGIESVPTHRYVFNGFTKMSHHAGGATENSPDTSKMVLDYECLTSFDLAPTILGFLGHGDAVSKLPGRDVYAQSP